MSSNTFGEDIGVLRQEWRNLDPSIRFIDLMTLLNILVFVVSYAYVSIFDTVMTATNATMLVYPLINSGMLFILRSKLANKDADHHEARKQFRNQFLMVIGLMIFGILFSILLAIEVS